MTDTDTDNTIVTLTPQTCKAHLGSMGLRLVADPKAEGMLRFFVNHPEGLVSSLRGRAGVTEVQADMLDLLNTTLSQAVDAALDAACLPIQNLLGMAGDYAGIHYSVSENVQPLNDNIARYMLAEITVNWND